MGATLKPGTRRRPWGTAAVVLVGVDRRVAGESEQEGPRRGPAGRNQVSSFREGEEQEETLSQGVDMKRVAGRMGHKPRTSSSALQVEKLRNTPSPRGRCTAPPGGPSHPATPPFLRPRPSFGPAQRAGAPSAPPFLAAAAQCAGAAWQPAKLQHPPCGRVPAAHLALLVLVLLGLPARWRSR